MRGAADAPIVTPIVTPVQEQRVQNTSNISFHQQQHLLIENNNTCTRQDSPQCHPAMSLTGR
jgi:hypothetical protein